MKTRTAVAIVMAALLAAIGVGQVVDVHQVRYLEGAGQCLSFDWAASGGSAHLFVDLDCDMTFDVGTDLYTTDDQPDSDAEVPDAITVDNTTHVKTIELWLKDPGSSGSVLKARLKTSLPKRYEIGTAASDPYPGVAIVANGTTFFETNVASGNARFPVPFTADNATQAGIYSPGPIDLSRSAPLTATGTACAAGCLTLSAMLNVFSTVGLLTCATLPVSSGASGNYAFVVIDNNGANTLLVCPAASGTTTINGGASTTVAAGSGLTCFDMGADWLCR